MPWDAFFCPTPNVSQCSKGAVLTFFLEKEGVASVYKTVPGTDTWTLWLFLSTFR